MKNKMFDKVIREAKYIDLGEHLRIALSYELNFEPSDSKKCFVYNDNMKKKSPVYKAARKLYDKGYTEYYIYGKYADRWKDNLEKINKDRREIQLVLHNKGAMDMSLDIAATIQANPEENIFVLTDYEYVSWLIKNFLSDILAGKRNVRVDDWLKFRKGYEFIYQGKDAIVVAGLKKCYGGFLNNLYSYDSFGDFYYEKIFNGRDFEQIWSEIRHEVDIKEKENIKKIK